MQQRARKFVAIGHITNDTGTPDRVGGGVSYAAVAAHRLGYEAHIISKGPAAHPHVAKLRQLGVHVHLLPGGDSKMTTFTNTYDAAGTRTQFCTAQASRIMRGDLPQFQHTVLAGSLIFVTPVLDEVDPALLPHLAHYGPVILAPQGYFRTIDAKGRVHQRPWDAARHTAALRAVGTILLGDEDITFAESPDRHYLAELATFVPRVICTHGAGGSTLIERGTATAVPAYPLPRSMQHDPTGLGDVYAAAYAIFSMHCTPAEAACRASFYAACKLYGFGRSGVDAVPTVTGVQSFIARDYDRASTLLDPHQTFLPYSYRPNYESLLEEPAHQ